MTKNRMGKLCSKPGPPVKSATIFRLQVFVNQVDTDADTSGWPTNFPQLAFTD